MKELLFDSMESPLGTILIAVDDGQMCALEFAGYESRMMKLLQRHYGPVHFAATTDPEGFSSLVRTYFAGNYHALDSIPVNAGGTPFQQQVWRALRAIPTGTTMSYGEMAAYLGKPAAARAVGSANGSNPIAIVVPCHRLIGADTTLTGYASGLYRKGWLLKHEGFAGLSERSIE